MPAVSLELQQLRPGLAIWQVYDNGVKADLFSSALAAKSGLVLVDPIELAEEPSAQLFRSGPLAGVVITNSNHLRAALSYVQRFGVPLFAHRNSLPKHEPVPDFIEVQGGSRICGAVEVITIEGAVPGEIALHHGADGGTFIVGDTLINFEPYGFTFLPDKYCEDAKQMRKSLLKLLPDTAERMLFAHGLPILSGASSRLKQLLDVDL